LSPGRAEVVLKAGQSMARRILNRKDLRADYEAAERRKQDNEEEGEQEEIDESDEETEAEDESEGDDEEAEEESPKKKKKVVAKEVKPKRTRTPKQVRMKVVWGVFNNSNQRVATFEYPKHKEAEEHAAKLSAAKNPPQPFFVQPIKEPMEDKKE
jgi:cobalamin biosynthesis protein CobT